jgi:hypothetical protein
VNEAAKVVLNYHKMSKKDSLSKVYGSVFTVLAKEGKRLQNQLDIEQMRIETMLIAERAREPGEKREKELNYGMSKELSSTGN